MYIQHLFITQFKNIEQAELDFSPKINVLYGNNGEGKTNLLDALYYLSVCKSFFSVADKDLLRHGADAASLFGVYPAESGIEEKIACSFSLQGDKVFKRNGKAYDRISRHVGLLPIVMVSPSDTILVHGAGEERRKYMNFLLSQTDATYLQTLQEYKKLLFQRNKILKISPDTNSVIEAVESAMIPRAQAIFQKRKELCELLRPFVLDYYHCLSDGKEVADLQYSSDLNGQDMQTLLDRNRQRDILLHFTGKGVQRDDVQFFLDGYPLKVCGSQGQQKTFLLSLKLAQFALMRQLKGTAPILLLDDVFDKLDRTRVEGLLRLVDGDRFGQIFITDSNKLRMDETLKDVKGPIAFFNVSGGVFFNERQRPK